MTEDRPLAREIRWPAVGLLAAFLVAGALTREPRELKLSAAGAVVAIAAASMLAVRGARTAVALAALAGAGVAGVAFDAGGHGQSLAWFGLCVLAFWVMIVAGPKLGTLFLLAAQVPLVAHLLTPHVDLGWTPWIAGVAVSAGGAALIARQQQLVTQLRAAQAGLAERSRAEERNRIARDLHDVIGRCVRRRQTDCRYPRIHGLGRRPKWGIHVSVSVRWRVKRREPGRERVRGVLPGELGSLLEGGCRQHRQHAGRSPG